MNTLRVITINRHRLGTDGHGVTTLIGLSGCPLNCKYCINKKLLKIDKIKEYTIHELYKKVMEDYCYFIGTDGGVCFGGGEPLLQIDSIVDFIKQTKAIFKTTVETSLNVDTDIAELLSIVSELIIDIKSINEEVYRRYTGKNNDLLLRNLKVINDMELQSKCKIRIPFIEGFTTDEDLEFSKNYANNLGFKNIDTFKYIIDANH